MSTTATSVTYREGQPIQWRFERGVVWNPGIFLCMTPGGHYEICRNDGLIMRITKDQIRPAQKKQVVK